MKKHCKISYEVIVPFSEETNSFTIIFEGNEYIIFKNSRENMKKESDVCAVFYNGIKYSTFAKFLKTLVTL